VHTVKQLMIMGNRISTCGQKMTYHYLFLSYNVASLTICVVGWSFISFSIYTIFFLISLEHCPKFKNYLLYSPFLHTQLNLHTQIPFLSSTLKKFSNDCHFVYISEQKIRSIKLHNVFEIFLLEIT